MKRTIVSTLCLIFVLGFFALPLHKATTLRPVQAQPGNQEYLAHASRLLGLNRDSAAQGRCDFGPDTCKFGYVWREAFPGDHVCVTGATRAQAANDNRLAAQRKVPGTDTCKPGFVWREASPTDHVCVTGATRSRTKSDNQLGASRRDPACAPPTCQKQCVVTRDECIKNNPRDRRKCVQAYVACVQECKSESTACVDFEQPALPLGTQYSVPPARRTL